MVFKPIFWLLFAGIATVVEALGTTQSAAAIAKLVCNDRPYKNARIKFWEEDFGLFQDDLLMETLSDENGTFKVQGNDTEVGWISPKVNILHNCNDETKECWRKVVIYIPKAFISESAVPEKIFDIGTLNLDAELPGETRDCLN